MRGSRDGILWMVITLVVVSGCVGRRAVTERLDAAEALLATRPDSALALVQSVAPSELRSRPLRARHSLLHAIALDKCYIDTTDLSVIQPAMDYYDRHGSADEKMKTFFYAGRIKQNRRDYGEAIKDYARAEQESVLSQDNITPGLLFMDMAAIFGNSYNNAKEKEYTERAMSSFLKAGKTEYYNLSHLYLAYSLQKAKEWVQADSLYKRGFALCVEDSTTVPTFLSHNATMKLTQPSKEPREAIDLLRRKKDEYRKNLTIEEWRKYAYAAALLGDNKTCDSILSQVEAIDETPEKNGRFWLYRIWRLQGRYEEADTILNAIYSDEDTLVDSLLSDSIYKSLSSFYEQQAEQERAITRKKKEMLFFAVLVFVAAILALSIVLKRRKEKSRREIERLLVLNEENGRLLEEKDNQTKDSLMALRKSFLSLYLKQFKEIGELSRAYSESMKKPDSKDILSRRVEMILGDIKGKNRINQEIEEQIDLCLDGIISSFREEIQPLSEMDVKFFSLRVIGFNCETIAAIMGVSTDSIYMRRSRLRKKIISQSSNNQEILLKAL